jgi:hypothetical protein
LPDVWPSFLISAEPVFAVILSMAGQDSRRLIPGE